MTNEKNTNKKEEDLGRFIEKVVVVTIASLVVYRVLKGRELTIRPNIINHYYIINEKRIPVRMI